MSAMDKAKNSFCNSLYRNTHANKNSAGPVGLNLGNKWVILKVAIEFVPEELVNQKFVKINLACLKWINTHPYYVMLLRKLSRQEKYTSLG